MRQVLRLLSENMLASTVNFSEESLHNVPTVRGICTKIPDKMNCKCALVPL